MTCRPVAVMYIFSCRGPADFEIDDSGTFSHHTNKFTKSLLKSATRTGAPGII